MAGALQKAGGCSCTGGASTSPTQSVHQSTTRPTTKLADAPAPQGSAPDAGSAHTHTDIATAGSSGGNAFEKIGNTTVGGGSSAVELTRHAPEDPARAAAFLDKMRAYAAGLNMSGDGHIHIPTDQRIPGGPNTAMIRGGQIIGLVWRSSDPSSLDFGLGNPHQHTGEDTYMMHMWLNTGSDLNLAYSDVSMKDKVM